MTRLSKIEVRRLATIERLDLDLGDGFCAFTGETGAGKSIIVDALGLLLGTRANSDLVRSGEDDLLVSGFWDDEVASRRVTSATRRIQAAPSLPDALAGIGRPFISTTRLLPGQEWAVST